ncbi:MFS transporter [Streptomyces sp. NPDC101227]|uniref:MFS transporter n=1 Tax=Streptomyces sp. NPDC101227 TaxID=3366136 RepID=UPI0037F8BD48
MAHSDTECLAAARVEKTEPAQNRWAVLAVLCVSLVLCGIDLTVLHVAVPSMSRELHPGDTALLWIVDVYALTVASLLVTCGTLGDRIGRKRMVLGGFALFGTASAAAAFSSSTGELIAARAALGAGAAMIMASTVALLRVVFPDARERAVALGIWTAAHSVGAAVGPLVGGVVTERWGWGAAFLVNVPIAAVILVIGARIVPESKNPAPRRWDMTSVALSIAGLASVVYALKQAGAHLAVSPGVLLAAATGTLLLRLFIRRQRRLAEPLLDLSLFASRRFSRATLCVVVCFGSYVALLFFLTQWLQQARGYAPLHAGLALMPLAAANAVGAANAPWLSGRWGAHRALTGALTTFAAALAALAGFVASGGTGAYGPLVPPLLAAGYGAGIVMTLGADTIMGAARPERSGEAAAIQETAFELGAGLGVAVLGTVLTGVSRLRGPAAHTGASGTGYAYDNGFAAVCAVAAVGVGVTAALVASSHRRKRSR